MFDDRITNKYEFYERTLLKEYFQNFKIPKENNYWIYKEGDNDNNPDTLKLPNTYSNSNLYKSPYYLEGHTDFIHYSSLEGVFNIVKNGQIRLNPLSHVNDPKELHFIDDLVGGLNSENLLFTNSEIKKNPLQLLKERVFTLSMCIVQDKEKPDSFEMWGKYGRNGDGVALILNIDNIHRYDWYNFHLSKVYYDTNEHTDKLKEFIKKHKYFLKDNNIVFADFDAFISPILAAHKLKYYHQESEVRLLTVIPMTYAGKFIDGEFVDLIDNDQYLIDKDLRSCINLKFRNNYNYSNYTHLKASNIPSISIEKIILGYKYDTSYAQKLENALNHFNKKNNQPEIKVEVSKLKEELGF